MRLQYILILAIGLMLSGCGGPSIVGKWDIEGGPLTSFGLTATMTFSKDGNYEQQISGKLPIGEIQANLKGSYTLKDKTLSLKNTAISTSGLPDALKKTAEEAVRANAEKANQMTIDWKSKDEITAESGGQTITLKRKQQ